MTKAEKVGIPKPPSHGVAVITEYLAYRVQQDLGTNNGQTALYWHLVSVINQHMKSAEVSNDNS